MAAEDEEDPAEGTNKVVALYDFDPSTIDWPFRRQRPLALTTGQMVQVIHDDGSEWALGHVIGQEDQKGYFPKNYTVSVAEYHDMMRDYEASENELRAQETAEEEEARRESEVQLPETRAIPHGPLPVPTNDETEYDHMDGGGDEPELVYPGISTYPVLEAQPPLATTFDQTKSRLMREMPAVPSPAPEEPAPPKDDILAARQELERELAARREDPYFMEGGRVSQSRASTPAMRGAMNAEQDYIRRHVPMDLQQKYLKHVSPLKDMISKSIRLENQAKPAYPVDLRVRSTTIRVSRDIEPPNMRMALQRSVGSGARWTQMFRPGFNDIVNESFKVGCNACILSNHYLANKEAREQFQKLHAQDVNGTLWFELQRRKEHLFYMRMDFVDVMMCHPDAWNFPDTAKIVTVNAGEPINPFHGWYAQASIDADKEMEDIDFLYTLRLRAFPEQTFQALSLGKIPEWVERYMTLHTEAQVDGDKEEDEATLGQGHGKAIEVDAMMMEAGLEDGEDIYVKIDELRLARERTVGPDVLDVKTSAYHLKGLHAMRIFLRSRGSPDASKGGLITPKMVKDMAAQLGILGDASHYWYCLFALRYPLAPEWECVVKNDTRLYLNLPEDRMQPVHPLIKRFREHLDDIMQNEFLWDYRGFVQMKCSECGIPDSKVWCMQCTDYFCANCFLQRHRSARGKKHWPMPIPGCQYLTGSEAARLSDHLPLLNVGFSNRRRFLARDNQSDKNGSRNGDPWLFFHADTFQAALQQAPEKHWYLKRLKPPRLAPGVQGYYYNFSTDVIADDASHILTKAHEQKAIELLQKNIRGALTRRRIRKETEAVLVIQKCKQMWDVQRLHGSNGENAQLLKNWYRKYKAKQDRAKLEFRVTRLQSIWRGILVRKEFRAMMRNTTRFQASFKGLLGRRRHMVIVNAALTVQRLYRGHLFGRRVMHEQHLCAARIQAMYHGVAQRALNKKRIRAINWIMSHVRGHFARKRVAKMHASGLKIQRNWRRFQSQLDVKIILYEKLENLRQARQDVLRVKLEDAAATLMQNNYRRHRDFQRTVTLKREKGEADKRTSTMLVALYTSASSLRHYIHPWWRHLPEEIQEVLGNIKGSLQRTIGLVPVTGKLANEELGRRGLRVCKAEHLTYDQTGKDPDLASHLLLSVTRHLLSHVPAELFGATVKWASYALGHQSVDIAKNLQGYFPKEDIRVGKEMPPHPGDSLNTLFTDFATIKHHHDHLMTLSDESLPCMVLSRLPTHHRHVFLTAEVLVTMRQALDSPSISTEDHLKFQGLDAAAGAQLMEVLGSEMDHAMPLDWPKTFGTVAALAAQVSTHVTEMKPEKKAVGEIMEKVKTKTKATKKTKEKEGKAKAKAVKKEVKGEEEEPEMPPETESVLTHFNRNSGLRILQQVGYLMSDQDRIVQAVLAQRGENVDNSKGQGVRQGRYISVTDKLFEMADRAKHDHCSFVLAVVLYHMVLRGLLLRVVYHRAAIAVQKRYRYLKSKSKKARVLGPTLVIQRFWRGLRAALLSMRKDDAAYKIQHSYKAWRWNRSAKKLVRATFLVQRIWLGGIQRCWMKQCHASALRIQKLFRGFQTRLTILSVVAGGKDSGISSCWKLRGPGLELIKQNQAELNAAMHRKSEQTDTFYTAQIAAIIGKARVAMHKHRNRNLETLRMNTFSLRSKNMRAVDKQNKLKMKGTLQPERLSVFEPFATALKRLEPSQPGRQGAQQSRVLAQVSKARRAVERSNPRTNTFPPHAAARRGRAALAARRLAKRPKTMASTEGIVDNDQFALWMKKSFAKR